MSSRPLFVFLKTFSWSKSKRSAACFQYILIALNMAYNKNKLYKNLNYWSRDMLKFDFLEKDLHHILCIIFQEKCFSCYIPGCDVINFEIIFIILIKPFFYMAKKSIQQCKFVEKENSFQGEIKSIFHHFKGLFICQKLFQTW